MLLGRGVGEGVEVLLPLPPPSPDGVGVGVPAIVSYLPLAYSFREMKGSLSALRDTIDRMYYRLPHVYITVNSYQKSLLRRFVSETKKIYVVANCEQNQ